MHAECHEFCAFAANKISRNIDFKQSSMLDVGGRNVNGSIYGLFPGVDITTIDIFEDEGVDFVADFSTDDVVDQFMLREKYDICLSTEVLEHSPGWPNIVKNMILATKPGGWIVITCATTGRPPHSAIDGHYLEDNESEYYGNVSEEDFVNLVQSLNIDLIFLHTTRTHYDLQALLRKK